MLENLQVKGAYITVNKMHKFAALCFSLIFLFLIITRSYATISQDFTPELSSNEKISDALLSKFQMDEEATTTMMVWLTDIDMRLVEEMALAMCVANQNATVCIDVQTDDISEISLQTYIEAKRAASSKAYSAQNRKIANALFSPEDILFISQYSPMILVNTSLHSALLAAASENVVSLDYYETTQYESGNPSEIATLQHTIPFPHTMVNNITRAADVHESSAFGYSGAGVKIGILDLYLPRISNFDHLNLTLHLDGANGGGTVTFYTHSDAVLEIISSIAPDADYYATSYSLTEVSGIFSRIEWLLDQGVNVINSSRIIGSQADVYDSVAKWLDHIAYQHDVHFVQAAGNDPSEIMSGSLAYNIITVGNLDVVGPLADLSEYTIADTSSRYSGSTCAYKPDLCAPGQPYYVERFDLECNGTSYAAPHVTGAIALLCEQRPALLIQQKTVKAILAASVNFDSQHSYVPGSDGYQKYGAGILDCLGACWVVGNYRYTTGSMPANGSDQTHTFTVTSSDSRIRVALSWNIKSLSSVDGHGTITSADTALPDLNLKIKDPTGTFVKDADGHDLCSATTNNNVEILDFVPTMTGTYTIVVVCSDNVTRTVPYSLAWR